MKKVFFGGNINNKPKVYESALLKEVMQSFGESEFQITIEKRMKKRSLKQNGFYFNNVISSQIQCFKEFWGEVYTPAQIHEWNKATFWADTVIVNNEPVTKPATSTKYSTIEWEERVDMIRAFFIEKFDWVIEYPAEQSTLSL